MRVASLAAQADGCLRGLRGDARDPRHADLGSGERAADFRYGVVFVLMLTLVVFVISAPSANWSRALALAIESAALVVAIATARGPEELLPRGAGRGRGADRPDHPRRHRHRVPGVHGGLDPLVTLAIPASIIRGSLRLLRERGVTLEAVAGGLAIYLALGLVVAWIIGFIIHVSSTPYFAQHTNGTEGDRVYFSFTVLTTTGFGDFSAANPVGHALSVIEMLTGQLYLVTIIGLLIGNYISRRMKTT